MTEPVKEARKPRGRTRADRPSPTPAEARRRLSALGRFHPAPGQIVAAVLTALLGIALVAQVRSADEAGLSQLRQSELVGLLDDVTGRAASLQQEVVQLEADRARLQGEQGDVAAVEAARDRLESYTILAGTAPVQGPGITVFVNDPDGVVTQTMLLDAIQELRDAGAEAIQVGNVRVVASTWVGTDAEGQLTLDGRVLAPPYRISAIGEAHTLSGAMAIAGGFSDSLRGAGASVDVVESDELLIDALHEPRTPRYARPVEPTDEP